MYIFKESIAEEFCVSFENQVENKKKNYDNRKSKTFIQKNFQINSRIYSPKRYTIRNVYYYF